MPSLENENSDAEYYRYLQLKQKMGGAPAQPEMGWGEYLGRGATDALPVAAMAGGGLLASALGPVASVAGGGLGYAAGSEAKGLLNHYAFNDELPSTKPIDQATRVAGNVLEGSATEMGGQVLGKLPGLLGQITQKTKATQTAQALEDYGQKALASSEKRNIVIKPILDELSGFRKILPETSGEDIDALITEIKAINKYGKVNAGELETVKSKIKDVLQSQETGPYLRRAAVLAQDAASGVKPVTRVDPFTKKLVGKK